MALLLNIKGTTGANGSQGNPGTNGTNGTNGTPGSNGTNGTNGATWLTGSGAPSDGIGSDNDLYLDTATANVYKKVAGTWA